MSATPRLTAKTAGEQLDLLEQRLHMSPARILEIPEDATVIEACSAFAALALIHDPRRYVTLPPQLAHRAQLACQALQGALEQFVAGFRHRATRELARDEHPLTMRHHPSHDDAQR